MAHACFDESTSGSLIAAVRATDDRASWNRFVAKYEPMLHRWLQSRGVRESVIPDVVGKIYLKLVENLPTFVYYKSMSFRGWLRTVARNAACDVEKRVHNRYEVTFDFQSSAIAARYAEQARRDADDPLDEFVDSLSERMQLANRIVRRVKARIDSKTWKAFYLTEVEGLSCEAAARKLRIKESSLYVYRFRVKKLLREEAENEVQ